MYNQNVYQEAKRLRKQKIMFVSTKKLSKISTAQLKSN